MNKEHIGMNPKLVKSKKKQRAAELDKNIYKKENRRKRRRMVIMQRTAIITIITLAGVGGTLLWWSGRADVKLEKQLQAGNSYAETQDYEDALASYQAALEIDSTSVKAYRAMAGTYLSIEDGDQAVQTLYKGWENTQDESLLEYCCTVILNEAIEDINNQNVSIGTINKCLEVLENIGTSEEAFAALKVCYERLFIENEQSAGNFYLCSSETSCAGDCKFTEYYELLNRMMAVYRNSPTEALKEVILQYAVIGYRELIIDMVHIQDYINLLNEIAEVEETSDTIEIKLCLEKALWVQGIFAPAFEIFDAASDSGNSSEFDGIKGFMNSQEYILIRDEFMAGTMESWAGKTYIPVSREKIKLIREEDGYYFSFLNYKEYPATQGVINIWGTKQEDAGVQRIAISYEPAGDGASDANTPGNTHITYEIFYLYSNVKINGEYVPQMNYRFEVKTETEEGLVTDAIGDWGGEHEWHTSY